MCIQVKFWLFSLSLPTYLALTSRNSCIFKGEIRQNVLLKETLLPVHNDTLDGKELYHLELVTLELLLTL